MPGRKPTYLKVVTGTTRSHKRGANAKPAGREPTAPRSTLQPPPHLSPRALECWGALAPMLDRLGVLTTADELALGETCEAFADVMAARASLAKTVIAPDGSVIAEGGSGTYVTRSKDGHMLRPRPEVAMLDTASKRFATLLGRFGLDPVSRSKITVGGASRAETPDTYFS